MRPRAPRPRRRRPGPRRSACRWPGSRSRKCHPSGRRQSGRRYRASAGEDWPSGLLAGRYAARPIITGHGKFGFGEQRLAGDRGQRRQPLRHPMSGRSLSGAIGLAHRTDINEPWYYLDFALTAKARKVVRTAGRIFGIARATCRSRTASCSWGSPVRSRRICPGSVSVSPFPPAAHA